jgi:acyl transferase domain-containing protein/acyl carrier protein
VIDFSQRIAHLSSVQLAFATQQIVAKSELMRAEPIAIIGMACRFPGGATSLDAFWRLLKRGEDAICEVPPERWNVDAFYDPDPAAPGKMCCRHGGFLDGVDRFDAEFFGISPREAVSMDPQQRVLLEVSWEALENANQPPDRLFGSPTGVFVGISTFDYAAIRAGLRNRNAIDAYQVSGTTFSVAAGRLSYLLGLTGPCVSIDTACSSSLVGIHLACQSLRNRESALALAAGVGLILAPEPSINFSKAGMLAPDGRCKTFDAAANGYVRAEGCGAIILKRLADALADGDRIHAVIRGSAVNQDGASGGLTVPSGPSQEAVIRQALAGAGITPLQVSYVEAHGTGTSLGDPIEINALAAGLCQGRDADHRLIVGSVKTNFGHLEAASGIAGLIKVVLSLRHRQIPAHLHLKTPTPHIDWKNIPIDVASRASAWLPEGGRRIAGVSAFGFSGTNAHIVLEEAPAEILGEEGPGWPLHLLGMSAKTETALTHLVVRYLQHLEDHPEQGIGEICHTANTGRSHFAHRLAFLAATTAELKDQLTALNVGGRANASLAAPFPGVWRSGKPVSVAAGPPLRFEGNGQMEGLGKELERMATAYVSGARIDWDHFYAETALRFISLPSYPFLGERFWLETSAMPFQGGRPIRFSKPSRSVDRDSSGISDGGSCLPGRRLNLPMSSEIRFETIFRPDFPALLADHILFGTVVVAGATWLAMVLRAAGESFHRRDILLEEVLLSQALALPEGDVRLVQTLIAPAESEGRFNFQVMSLDAEAGDDVPWDRHVAGKIRIPEELPDPPLAAAASIRDTAATFWESLDAQEFYKEISEAGHHLGDAFRRIRNIWTRGHEALCLLAVPDAADGNDGLPVPPGLIDSCFQVFCIRGERLWAAGTGDPKFDGPPDRSATYIPFSLGEVRFFGRKTLGPAPGGPLWCHTTIRGLDPLTRGMSGDITLFDAQGRTVLKISGMSARKLTQNHLLNRQMGAANGFSAQSPEEGLYRVDWFPIGQPPTRTGNAAMAKWLIFSDRGGIGETLGDLLRKQGEPVLLIFPGSEYGQMPAGDYRIQPGEPADISRLMGECCNEHRPLTGILFLWSLDAGEETIAGSLEGGAMPAWESVLYLVRALSDGPMTVLPRLWLVTRCAQWVLWSEPGFSPHHSPLWGMANGIRAEHTEWNCTCIDLGLPDSEDQTALLFESIRSGEAHDRIAIRGDSRYGARIMPLALLSTGTISFRKEASYLITGGLGALGLETARWLAEKGATYLVLVGRGEGSAVAREQVAALVQSGVKVTVLRTDISKRAEVLRMLTALSGMPPLRGIIHTAGVLSDGLLMRQDRASFQQVLLPKAVGAWNLHEATLEMNLDFFICYSSAAAILGAAGQANYAAANAFLDALVRKRRSRGLHGLSVNWGPWELGMAAELKRPERERMATQGFRPIRLAEGFNLLERLLLQDLTQALVLPMHWESYFRTHYRGAIPPFYAAVSGKSYEDRGIAPEKSSLLHKLEGTPLGQRRPVLFEHVHQQVAATLRMTPSKRVPAEQGLFDLGLDSLMAMELKNRLEADLERALRPTLVFDYPTVAAITGYLAGELGINDEAIQEVLPADSEPEPTEALSGAQIDAAIVDELARLESLLKGG